MTYSPPQIYGPIIPRTNSNGILSPSLPGLTYTGSGFIGSGTAGELYCKTPSTSSVGTGTTSDIVGQLFLNNYFTPTNINLISCFIPEYYIDMYKNIQPTLNRALNSVTLSSVTGQTYDRYEILTISYDEQSFLTNLSGNTANAITNLQVNHQIVAGGTTINADYIFYRKLGRFNMS